MKAGVSTVPCGVSIRPSRAAPSVARTVKRMDMCKRLAAARSAARALAPPSGRPLNWGLVAPQRQPELGELLADLVQRRHAEVFRLQQFVGRALDEVAERVDAQPV